MHSNGLPRAGLMAPRNLATSAWLFIQGVAKRSYFWLFALLLDPFDIFNRFIKPSSWPTYNVEPKYFWLVLSGLVLWTSILTFHELRMAFIPAPPRKADPPDIVNAKARIADFVANVLAPADLAVTEAVRLSAYAFQQAWNDTPAGRLGWSGIMLAGTGPSDGLPRLRSMDWLRSTPIPNIEQALLGAVVKYRTRVHKLHEVVHGMIEHGRLRDHVGFFESVRQWRPLHDQLVNSFNQLRRAPEFGALRDADENVYLNDPGYDLAILEPILVVDQMAQPN